MKIRGFISVKGYHKNSLQFVYVNNRIIHNNQITKRIRELLNLSLILQKPSGSADATDLSNQQQNPVRQIEKYQIYIINIICSPTSYDITYDPTKTIIEFVDYRQILNGLTHAIKKFLHSENLTMSCDIESVSSTSESSSSNCASAGSSKESIRVEQYGLGISTKNLKSCLLSDVAYNHQMVRVCFTF